MSYKVVVLKANGDVEKYPFESGASVSDIKNLLKSDNIETARGVIVTGKLQLYNSLV